MSNIIASNRQAAIFFQLDGVVRRISPSIAEDYKAQLGEVPPAPVHLGEQELIMPVVNFIRKHVEETGAIPIALDMAPYVSHGVMPIENYQQILAETISMLRMAGVPMPQNGVLYCTHPGKEIVEDVPGGPTTIDGQVVNVPPTKAKRIVPDCDCRFPNPGLIKKAAEVHNIFRYNDHDDPKSYRFFKPTLFVVNDQEARTAAIENCGLNVQWVEGILNGSHQYKDMVTNAHLKAAALLKRHAEENHLDAPTAQPSAGWDTGAVHLDARSLPAMPALPSELDRPAGSAES